MGSATREHDILLDANAPKEGDYWRIGRGKASDVGFLTRGNGLEKKMMGESTEKRLRRLAFSQVDTVFP